MSDATGKVAWNPDTLVDGIADVNARLANIETQVAGVTVVVVAAMLMVAALYVVKGKAVR
jgi:hypothetical protein